MLTARGREQARAAGSALGHLALRFEEILYSPKARARETAELAAEAWEQDQRACMREHAALASGFDARAALDAAAGIDADGRLLLVGHEPDLSNVVAELGGGRVDLKKGGLAVLRLDGPAGELVALLRPRELAVLALVPASGD